MMNGGSIVIFADGDPLFYPVNLFLESAEFPIFDDDINFEEKEIEFFEKKIKKINIKKKILKIEEIFRK